MSSVREILSLLAVSVFLYEALSMPLTWNKKDLPDDLTENTYRVVNGVPVTDKKEYPFVVDLSAHPVAVSSSRFCTGTLIRKDIVLTAAHCVLNDGYMSPVYATVGRIELDDFHEENKEAETFTTVAGIVHPEYRGLGSGSDVALLLLNGSSTSPTVALASDSPNEDQEVWVVGYGVQKLGTVEATARPVEVLSGRLQKTALRIKDKTFCDIPQADIRTAEGMLCTAGVKEGSSACKGDSGGGLFLRENLKTSGKESAKHQNKHCVQVGVVSYGDSMCMSEDSGVFTDVSRVKDWIDESAERLQQAFHPVQIEMTDANEEAVVHSFVPVSTSPSPKLLLQGSGRNETMYGENVKFYRVNTNFTAPKVLTISLCDGPSKTRTRLHVMDSSSGAVYVDKGSYNGGKQAKLSFKPGRGNYVLGISTEDRGPIRMNLSTEKA